MSIVDAMIYATAIAMLLAFAGWLLERGAAGTRLPRRWVWAGVMALSIAIPGFVLGTALGREDAPLDNLPFVVQSSDAPAATGEAIAPLAAILRLLQGSGDVLAGGIAMLSGWIPDDPSLGQWVLGLWVATAVLLGVLALASHLRLLQRSRRWREAEVDGRRVRVSEDVGPAALGALRPSIIVPRWALARPHRDLRLILDHEEEHVRARDPLLLSCAFALAAAAPWNVALWWQLRRLRDAVEVDCDRRVLARGASAARYGTLLLELGGRTASDLLPAAAISGSPSLLERRLRSMKTDRTRRALPALLASSLIAVSIVAVACQAEPPEGPTEPRPAQADVERTDRGDETGAPDREGFRAQGERVSISAEARARSDREDASRVPVAEPEPQPEPEPEPTPAPEPEPSPQPDPEPEPAPEPEPEAQPAAAPSADTPTFTPFTVAPNVTNREAIAAALQDAYPADLRDAGIGGTTIVQLFIGSDGALENVLVAESSGLDALDAAALRVAREFQFDPALNRNDPVSVWIQVPVTFQTQE